MRALLERSRLARSTVVVLATLSVVGLAQSAMAGGDLGLPFGLKPFDPWPEPQAVPSAAVEPAVAAQGHRHARRIWAASGTRPLRITLRRRPASPRLAAARHPAPAQAAARPRRPSEPQVARVAILPKPSRPALVSIYQDRTLRDGDAVMMADGIHLFHGAGAGPYRPRDFVRLQLVASLGWHLRQTLNDLDRNPPIRWSAVESTSG